LAASSHDSVLLPINSITLYMLSGIEASFGLFERNALDRDRSRLGGC